MSKSPTIQGLTTVFRGPLLGLTEIAWRWSFALGSVLLIALAALEFLGSVRLTKAGTVLTATKNPLLMAIGVADAFQGTGRLLMTLAVVLALALTVLWIFASALGRTATVKALWSRYPLPVARFPNQASGAGFRAVLGLSFLRAALALAAVVALAGAAGIAYWTGGPTNAAAVGFLCVAALLLWLWAAVNWTLVLAAIFPASSGVDTLGAVGGAVALFRRHMGRFFAVNTWFGLAHAALFLVAVFVAVRPAAMIAASPQRGVAMLVAIVFGYAAVVDFLYIARLAAYVAIAGADDTAALPSATPVDAPEVQRV